MTIEESVDELIRGVRGMWMEVSYGGVPRAFPASAPIQFKDRSDTTWVWLVEEIPSGLNHTNGQGIWFRATGIAWEMARESWISERRSKETHCDLCGQPVLRGRPCRL